MPQEAFGELYSSTGGVALLANLGEVFPTSYRRLGVSDRLYIMGAVAIGASSLVQLAYLISAELYGFAVEAAHIGIIDLFHYAVASHKLLVAVAAGAGLGNVLFVSRGVILQHSDYTVGGGIGAMAVDAGGYIRVTLHQLLPVNTFQVQRILVLMAGATFLRQGKLGERGLKGGMTRRMTQSASVSLCGISRWVRGR